MKKEKHLCHLSESFFDILTSSNGPEPYGWTIRTLWSWTVYNLEEYSKFKCSRTIFEKHTAPGAYSKHTPGAVRIPNMVLDHI